MYANYVAKTQSLLSKTLSHTINVSSIGMDVVSHLIDAGSHVHMHSHVTICICHISVRLLNHIVYHTQFPSMPVFKTIFYYDYATIKHVVTKVIITYFLKEKPKS